MVDEVRVLRLLRSISDDLAVLRAEASADPGRRADPLCSSSEGASVGLLLQAVEIAGPHRWRWLLVDERSGAALADHPMDLDPRATETEAFEDLYRFLRWRANPDCRLAGETELVGRVRAWIGSAALASRSVGPSWRPRR